MLEIQLPEDLQLPSGAASLLQLLVHFPLSTAGEMVLFSGVSSSLVYDRLGDLRDEGLVESVSLGWYGSLSQRWYLTNSALASLGLLGATWHEEYPRCRLLERLPSVEWFYRVAAEVRDLGPFQSFHWLDGVSLDAVVRYQHGWIALFWSGAFQSEDWIANRLEALASDLRYLSVSFDTPWPGLLAFVVNDQWQRELVYRAARRQFLDDRLAVWCARDGVRSGVPGSRASRGWVSQPVQFRDTGGWSWDRRLGSSLWTNRRGQSVGVVLDVMGQWPGMTLEMARSSLGEGPRGKSAQYSCKALHDGGFAGRVWHGRKYHYMATSKGVDCISRRDRVHYTFCTDRVDSLSWVNQKSLRDHEEGIMSFMAHFLARKLPVAAGWRSWEHLGRSGGIAPDGMVFLERSPFGPVWAYFEYERSARTESRIRRKLKGYGAGNRGNDWPVLVVCWDEAAEAIFQRVGRELRLPMLTATIGRLEQYGPLDNLECWSDYGGPALIG